MTLEQVVTALGEVTTLHRLRVREAPNPPGERRIHMNTDEGVRVVLYEFATGSSAQSGVAEVERRANDGVAGRVSAAREFVLETRHGFTPPGTAAVDLSIRTASELHRVFLAVLS